MMKFHMRVSLTTVVCDTLHTLHRTDQLLTIHVCTLQKYDVLHMYLSLIFHQGYKTSLSYAHQRLLEEHTPPLTRVLEWVAPQKYSNHGLCKFKQKCPAFITFFSNPSKVTKHKISSSLIPPPLRHMYRTALSFLPPNKQILPFSTETV